LKTSGVNWPAVTARHLNWQMPGVGDQAITKGQHSPLLFGSGRKACRSNDREWAKAEVGDLRLDVYAGCPASCKLIGPMCW
jgi:hypothetical protein